MNNYLDNLVLRTLGLAPVAKPRLAALFESPVVLGSTAAHATAREEMSSAEPAGPRDVRGTVSQGVLTTIHVVQAQSEKREVGNAPAARAYFNDPKLVERREVMPVSAAADAKRALKTESQIADAPKSKVQTPPVAVAKAPIDVRSESGQEKVPIASNLTDTDGGLWRKLEPRVRQVVRDELPPPDSARENAGQETSAIQPQIGSAIAPPSKHDFIAPAVQARPVITNTPAVVAAPAPEITVTIGRVDVRAVVSPAAQTGRRVSPRSPSPTSLDQYLKERSEGRR